MCLYSRTGRSNAKVYRSMRPGVVEYKCGYCPECVKEKRNEWLLRAYFESLDTITRGGYVLFDTLTYDDAHLPHISDWFPDIKGTYDDYSCFSFVDYRGFTNRFCTQLNRELKYHGMEVPEGFVKDNVNFFLVSEYGHEDEYTDDRGRRRKGTFRPHYHILVYVKDKRIPPGMVSNIIYKEWQKGDTDNHRNGYMNMMQRNIIGKGYTRSATKNVIAVCNYVSKYITKQADNWHNIATRIDRVTSRLYCPMDCDIESAPTMTPAENEKLLYQICRTRMLTDEWYSRRDEVKRYVAPFHRQSRGFGSLPLYDEKYRSQMVNDFCLAIPDTQYGMKKYGVPLYYRRKLYQEVVKDAEGKPHWRLNAFGRANYHRIVKHRWKSQLNRYQSWYSLLSDADRTEVDAMLDGRTFADFADYLMYYRGRLLDEEASCLPAIDEVIVVDRDFDPSAGNETREVSLYYDTLSADEKKALDDAIQCLGFPHDYVDEPRPVVEVRYNTPICSLTDYRFRRFDALLAKYRRSLRPADAQRQRSFDVKERQAEVVQALKNGFKKS